MENISPTNNPICCKICILEYNDDEHIPKVMPCGHSICKTCYATIIFHEKYKCPFCQKEFSKNIEPLINYEILSMVHFKKVDNSCPTHQHELLNFYCEEDQVLLCQYCLLKGHLGHKIVKPEDSPDMSKCLNSIKQFKEFEKIILDKKYSSNKDIKEVYKKIDDSCEKFTELLQDFKNHLKFEYFTNFKKLSDYLDNFQELDTKLVTEYEKLKKGSKLELNNNFWINFQDNFNFIKNNYNDFNLTNGDDNLLKNNNFVSLLTVVDLIKNTTNEIKNKMDVSLITKPEFSDIENIVEYILDGRITSIRYKLNTSSLEMKKLAIVTALRSDCSNEYVINILKSIDRADFVPDSTSRYDIYVDSPLKIGWNTTISAPHMHTITLNSLSKFVDKFTSNSKTVKIIDIGSGSGYMSLALTKLFGPNSITYSIDHIEEIVDFTKNNINKQHKQYIESGRIKFAVADGRIGYPEMAKFNIIHVGAACVDIPEELIEQLVVGGIMWIPVGPKHGTKKICIVTKELDGNIKKTELMKVSYAELSSREEQLNANTNLSYIMIPGLNMPVDSD